MHDGDGLSASPRVSRAHGYACNNARRYLARIFMRLAILRAGGDTRKPARDVIGVETISSSSRERLSREYGRNPGESNWFNDQRDFYCRLTWQNACKKWMEIFDDKIYNCKKI